MRISTFEKLAEGLVLVAILCAVVLPLWLLSRLSALADPDRD